jgi:hypothetical protein
MLQTARSVVSVVSVAIVGHVRPARWRRTGRGGALPAAAGRYLPRRRDWFVPKTPSTGEPAPSRKPK